MTMGSKEDTRRLIRELKRAVPMAERLSRSEAIMHRVESLPEFKTAEVVLLYWSMADEVQTHSFVDRWHRDKVVLLPCVDGDMLRLRQYTGPECMVSGEQFGIGEPRKTENGEWNAASVECIVVPGVAFDRNGNRMGRGRGFYDRLLKSATKAVKVGVCYDFQLVDEVPTEPHDVRMDIVIAENHE